MAKTWAEKLRNGKEAVIANSVRQIDGFPPGSKMLIPTPLVVKEYVDSVPRGESRPMERLRADLAQASGADVTCPLVSGIFIRIVAEAALDEYRAGKSIEQVTPFWRVLDERSKATKKLSCGQDLLSRLRSEEGID